MAFDSLHAFLAMGGHGPYVWLSYGIVILGLTLLVLLSRHSHQRWLRDQRRQLARHQARASSSAPVGDPS